MPSAELKVELIQRAGGQECAGGNAVVGVRLNDVRQLQRYLGDIVICPREEAFFPEISVEQGIRVFLTGGMTLPIRLTEDNSDSVTGR